MSPERDLKYYINKVEQSFNQIKLGKTKEEKKLRGFLWTPIKEVTAIGGYDNRKAEAEFQELITALEQYKKTTTTPQNQELIDTTIHAVKEAIAALFPERLQKLEEEELARQAAEDLQRKTAAEEQKKATMEPARLEKLKKLVRVSESLEVPQMAKILSLTEDDLYARIVDWADQFGFTLDKDTVEFGAGHKDDFIASLDKEFASWGKQTGGKV